MKVSLRFRILGALALTVVLVVVAAIAGAVPGEDLNTFRRLVQVFSYTNPANGGSYGGLSVGQEINKGTRISKHYACLVENVAPPALATSCTSEQVVFNNGAAGYNLLDPSCAGGVNACPVDNTGTQCKAMFNALKKGDACWATLGTNGGGTSGANSYSIGCFIPSSGPPAQVNLKFCTNGTITPTAQAVLVTAESYQ